jgi:hypothetical protein
VVINPSVVLATERKQVVRVGPVVAHMSKDGSGHRHALTRLFLANPFVVVVAHIDEWPFLLVRGAGGAGFLSPCRR